MLLLKCMISLLSKPTLLYDRHKTPMEVYKKVKEI